MPDRAPFHASPPTRTAGRHRTTPPVRRPAGLRRAALLLLVPLLGACAPAAPPEVFAVPSAAAARIRMTCPPGTFIGTMTANCPVPPRPAAPPP